MRKINRIYIHHSATARDTTTFEWVDNFHREKGWGGIGYHFFVDAGGSVYKVRPEAEEGIHAKWDNQTSIGICLAGNFQEEDPSPAQMKHLLDLLACLCKTYGLSPAAIVGHRDRVRYKWWKVGIWFARTDCPGKILYARLKDIRAEVGARLTAPVPQRRFD